MSQDKIALLMEETGCDRGEAELALEMCSFKVEDAVKAIARSLKNILVIKGKFIHPDRGHYGLVQVILNTKSGSVLRARAVVSFNPAVYEASLEKDWFEFEKYLYGCRLWDGSLQAESLETERGLAERFRAAGVDTAARMAQGSPVEAAAELAAVLKHVLQAQVVRLKVKKDVLDVGQFRSFTEAEAPRRVPQGRHRTEELLVLDVALQDEPTGYVASQLRVGDMVSTRIVDSRDIGQYLAKLFGGYSHGETVPIMAPVEAVESGPEGVLVRLRFSVGVCGDARVAHGARVKAVRIAVRNQESHSWWKRFFNAGV